MTLPVSGEPEETGQGATGATGDCGVCGQRAVKLREYTRRPSGEPALACNDEQSCFAAWQLLRGPVRHEPTSTSARSVRGGGWFNRGCKCGRVFSASNADKASAALREHMFDASARARLGGGS